MKTPLFGRAAGFSAAAAFLAAPSLFAADVTWDNPGTGLFSVGTNWDTDAVPGNTDDAIIGNGGTAEIETGDIIAVSRLLINNGTVTQTGGTTSTVPFGNFESPGAYAIGTVSGQTGTYTISGASQLSGGRMRIGNNGGNGSVSIGNTSTYNGAAGQDTWVGNGTGSVGSLTITDSAQWNVNQDWFVAGRDGGTGTLTMSESAHIGISGGGNFVMGTGAGANATANISGSSTVTLAGGEIWVGNAGATGELNLSGDAVMTAQDHWIAIGRRGDGPGGDGTATISGNAELRKEGASNDRHIVIGDGGGSVGSVTVEDSGVIYTNQGLRIGQGDGTGTLVARDGALIDVDGGGPSGALRVGDGDNSVGTLTVQNTATVDVSGEIWVGNNGEGTINLEGGTINSNNWVAIGRDGTSSGTLNISGGTFNKTGNGNFIVNGATGIVNQTGGALNVIPQGDDLGNGNTWLSEQGGKNTTWTATGGTANLGRETQIGRDSVAVMTIGGTANYTNQNVILGRFGGGNGTLNLNGGTFTANSITEGEGSGTLNFNGGLVRAGAASGDFLGGFEDGDIAILAGGLHLDTNGFDLTITQALAGAGGLVKEGAGTLSLTSLGLAYNGDTVIEGGTLSINTAFLSDTSDVYLSGGGIFDLNFDATDAIAKLFINGNMMAVGTWGAIGSGADFESALFTGDGLLLVAVPEPAHYAMGVGLLLGLVILARRKRAA